MQLFLSLVFVGLVTASRPQMAGESVTYLVGRSLGGLVKREACTGGGNTCETACGPGYQMCVYHDTCYNPSAGEVCCSNGEYCPAGFYCTNARCCQDGKSLEECGATATVSIIPPAAATKQPSESVSRSQAPTATTAPATVATPIPPVVTAGVGKNTEVGALAAIGGMAALLLAM